MQSGNTPTVMLSNGKKLRHPIAYANIQNDVTVSVGKLPCCGEGCYEATRALFERSLQHEQAMSLHDVGR